jgi:hypothetical protein
MTLQEDLQASLNGDVQLMELLTGGVYSDTHISRATTPAAFDDAQEIKPCALLKMGVETAVPPLHRSSRAFVEVYLYQYIGYGVINAARDRIYELWHEQRIGERVWQMLQTDDVNDQVDDALGCSLVLSRYVVNRMR